MDIYDIYALGFLIVVGALYYAYNETRKKLASSSEENYLILSEKEKVEDIVTRKGRNMGIYHRPARTGVIFIYVQNRRSAFHRPFKSVQA